MEVAGGLDARENAGFHICDFISSDGGLHTNESSWVIIVGYAEY